jgi:hypothetical protein
VVAENDVDCEPLGMECHPLQYYVNQSYFTNDAIFQFKGSVHSLTGVMKLHQVHNVTLMGLDQDNSIDCTGSEGGINIYNSTHITVTNIKLMNCEISSLNLDYYPSLVIESSFDVTVTSLHVNGRVRVLNAFNTVISSSHFAVITFNYTLLRDCLSMTHYYLKITNISVFNSNAMQKPHGLFLAIEHGLYYHLSVTFDDINVSGYSLASNIEFILTYSLYSISINDVTSHTGFHGLLITYRDSLELNDDCNANNLYISLPIYPLNVTNSSFHNNVHGIYLQFQSAPKLKNQAILIKGCFIYNNSNIEGGFGLVLHKDLVSQTPAIYVVETHMKANRKNGIFNMINVYFINATITDSLWSGLFSVQSEIFINGTFNVLNNMGDYGGGICLLEGSSLYLFPGSEMNVAGNHATKIGGGFYSNTEYIGCYINVLEDSNSIEDNVTITLANNTASKVGGDVYGMNLNYCASNIEFITADDSDIDQTTNPQALCFCTSSSYNGCSFNPLEQSIFPGQEVTFSIAQWGYGYSTLYSITIGVVDIYLDGDLVDIQSTGSGCTSLSYRPTSVNSTSTHVLMFANHGLNLQSLQNTIDMQFFTLPCPFGFAISSTENVCTCNPNITSRNLDGAQNTISCDIETLEITREGKIWIGPYDTTTNMYVTQPNSDVCLINEFCILCNQSNVTFMLNDTDLQCPPYKSGPLCRLCANGSSLLLGSNECEECDNNNNIALIIVFVIMGILLVVLLIVLNLTVSVGTINGLLFTANIIKLYTPVFVGFYQQPYPFFHQILAWLNLDFGIETCFYSGMDRYGKEWLQFVFPFYVWSIMIIIIIAARKSSKVSKLVGTNAVPVLATLLLLSYTKLLSTIVTVFNKQDLTLHCNESSPRTITVWYEDPTVKYASGKHLALFLFALLVFIVFCIPYTLFLLLIPFVEKYLSKYRICSYWNKLKPIIDAYCGPMKDEYRFWPGLLLIARIPLLLAVSLVNSVIGSRTFLLSILVTVLMVIFSLAYCFRGVYIKPGHNVIESWFLFLISAMAALAIAFDINHAGSIIWFNMCISIFHFSFFAIIIYHMYQRQNVKVWSQYVIEKAKLCTCNCLTDKLKRNKKSKGLEDSDTFDTITTTKPLPVLKFLERDSVTNLFEIGDVSHIKNDYYIIQKPD